MSLRCAVRRTLGTAQAGQCLAQVTFGFNQRNYRFQCTEDEAERLEQLANYLKSKLDALMREHGAIGDERLVLMAALTPQYARSVTLLPKMR